MSYDIPDEITYKEKIMLNLDAKQLVYAIAFGVLALILYNLKIQGELKFVLPAISVCAGIAFVFFNLESKVLDRISYFGGVRKASPFDSKAQKLVAVKAIQDDVIYLDNNQICTVLKIEPVNFSLLDENRKKSLTLNYREFLNHLSEPVQVLVKTVDVSLSNYFGNREKNLQHSSKKLAQLYYDFRQFEEAFIEENAVKERLYYLIIPHIKGNTVVQKITNSPEGNSLKKLSQKTKIIQEKLEKCGLKVRRLADAELSQLFRSYSSYSSDIGQAGEEIKQKTAVPLHKRLLAFIQPANKQKNEEEIFRPMITPSFDIKSNYAIVNETYHRIVKAAGYPRKVEDGWLESFLSENQGYDISLHIHPSTISQTLVMLHNQIVRQTADLVMSTGKGNPNPALEIKKGDTTRVYEQLYKGEEKLFRMSLYIDNKETDIEKLDLLTENCKANLNSLLIVPRITNYRMAQGIQSTLPIAMDSLDSQREFLTSPLSATFPFISPVGSQKSGILFAHEEKTLNPLFVNFESMSNKHFFILGISGSGKSYTAKYLIMQHLLDNEAKVFILDPNAEYKQLTRQLGGEIIEISKDSDSIINVFDLGNDEFSTKLLSLISVFDIITGGLSESQKGVLNEALVRVYRKKGIDPKKPATMVKEPPTFSDLKRVLAEMLLAAKKKQQVQDERSMEVLINRVRMYSKGGFFSFLDTQTRINLASNFINFDISSLPHAVKQLMMFVVLDLISKEIRRDRKPKVVLIDEGWSLLRSKEAENYVLEFVKTSRKYNTSIGFITQEIEDLLNSEGGKSIINTTSTKILMRQNSSNLKLVGSTLNLNGLEEEYLIRAEKGHGLLITEYGRYKFFTKAPLEIHTLITTDPNETAPILKEPKKEESKPSEVEIAIDISKGFYRESELNEEQKDILRKEGYVRCKTKLTGKEGSANYLVKKQGNESPEHAFMCWVVAYEFKKLKINATVNASTEPDVVAQIGMEKVCFEIETGTSFTRVDIRKLQARFESRKKEYKKAIIVVTDRLDRERYAQFCQAITRFDIVSTVGNLVSIYSGEAKP